jgi:hypothetical protein
MWTTLGHLQNSRCGPHVNETMSAAARQGKRVVRLTRVSEAVAVDRGAWGRETWTTLHASRHTPHPFGS